MSSPPSHRVLSVIALCLLFQVCSNLVLCLLYSTLPPLLRIYFAPLDLLCNEGYERESYRGAGPGFGNNRRGQPYTTRSSHYIGNNPYVLNKAESVAPCHGFKLADPSIINRRLREGCELKERGEGEMVEVGLRHVIRVKYTSCLEVVPRACTD
ncbi:hypothetical protein PIB30_001490 [Stylosanthes scabra]|uniref:Uncharacterized protein n=1 Tax=Stylosanthes scabra TaxID=79078 RepID=A0ABU6Q2L1_9FABA|nr:hypothetical protein [Stylosanthes scabra]